jgi:hypothetical protein
VKAPAAAAVCRLTISTLALLFCGVLVLVKLGSLDAWRYTSDLFTYDQILTEALRGHLVDYTFGWFLGEHAVLLLYLLLPIKALLGRHAVDLILLLPTLLHGLAAILLYRGLRQLGLGPFTALGSALCFLFSYRVVEALYCSDYGAQVVDTPAGPLAALLALTAILAERGRVRPGWIWAWLLPLLLLREDIALLAAVYFTLVSLQRRDRRHLRITIVCWAMTLAEWTLIRASATPFNFRVGALVAGTLQKLRVTSPEVLIRSLPDHYLLPLLALVGAMVVAVLIAGRWSPHPAALFVIGLLKIAMGYVAQDTNLSTWHNQPGVVMITVAIVLQLAVADRKRARAAMLVLLLAASGVDLFHTQLPFLELQMDRNARSQRLVAGYRVDLLPLIEQVPPERVVAIPAWTAIEWTRAGRSRFCFTPRGLTGSPRGIADYLVLETPLVQIRSPFDRRLSPEEIRAAYPEFRVAMENRHFVLLERVTLDDESRAWRAEWIRRFGSETLGLAAGATAPRAPGPEPARPK